MRIFSLLLLTALLVSGCGGSSSDDGSANNGNSGSGQIGGGDNGGSGSDGSGGSGGGGSETPDPIPTPEPMPDPDGTFADQMLTAVNAARAVGRNCGSTFYPAVAPLTWDAKLQSAAQVHSTNMANYNFFNHTGLDGKSASDRVTDQGYAWRSVAENIAAGQKDIDTVMTTWLNSPGHCKNIMGSNYTQMGSAYDMNSGSQYNIYWTQVFATPQ
ncbi:CAP domain-containing protein [Photobacterium sanguinicancri]|uniref:CAP domain-containing protein n=1 Tax=Photobacterium sanguinicancri TaxID=875932 RepID=UPI003D10E05B